MPRTSESGPVSCADRGPMLICFARRNKSGAMALFDVVLQDLIVQTAINYEDVVGKCQCYGYVPAPPL